MIAYQTAYMKANYPIEFMAALLTAEANNKDKVALAVEECRRMEIVVFPPDINKSYSGFTVEKEPASREGKAIRFGFSAIKNVGQAAIKEILKVREIGDEFQSGLRIDHEQGESLASTGEHLGRPRWARIVGRRLDSGRGWGGGGRRLSSVGCGVRRADARGLPVENVEQGADRRS